MEALINLKIWHAYSTTSPKILTIEIRVKCFEVLNSRREHIGNLPTIVTTVNFVHD